MVGRPRSIRPGVRHWLRLGLGRADDVRDEVDEEIRTHLTLLTEELMRQGLSRDGAQREAERQFGPIGARRAELHRLAEQRSRLRERTVWWSGVRQDLRVALRGARRSPALTIVATLILGLGIGVSTAVFSVFDSVILRPLPYHDPSRLVIIWETGRSASSEFLAGVFDNHRDVEEWVSRSRSFDGIAELTWAEGTRVYRPENGPPRSIVALPTSANLFDVLGVRAQYGRTFARDDAAHGCAVVLSHAFWRSTFGADARVIGTTITLGDARCAVLGVMPASFEFYPRQTAVWSLMTPATDTLLARHPDHYLVGAFARLRPGVSAATAQRELRAIQASSPDQTPFNRSFTPTVFDLQQEFTWLAGRNLHTTLVILLGAVALVLLVVCVNIANLSLGRAAAREREFAVRIAIGSGRWRLVRQLLAESGVLACCGSIVGLAIAFAGMRYVNSGRAMELPPDGAARLDLTALAATVVMAVFATIVVGIAPALRATRVNTADALKSSGRGASGDRRSGRVANVLVVCQVSASVTLLVAAGLLLQSLSRLGSAPLGYSPENVVTMDVSLTGGDTVAVRGELTDALMRAQAVPGVVDAAWTSAVPLRGRGDIEPVVVESQPASQRDSVPDVGRQIVSERYFRVMRVSVIGGRAFTAADDQTRQPVAIVNRAFVERFIGTTDAIGQRIRVGGGQEPWLTIVGVVGNERRTTVTQEMSWITPPMVFSPLAQAPTPHSMMLIARSGVNATVVVDPLRRAVASVAGDAIIGDVATMHELLDEFLASPRTRAEALAALALLALTLAVIGLYGLLSQVVVNRTREIGIRVALGAQVGQVVSLVVRRGIVLAATGVALGCVLALPAVQAMRALLYGVTAFDPATLALAAAAMIVTAFVASLLPARRAAAVDPAIALRSE